MKTKSKVVVTGSTGWIGQETVAALLADWTVVEFDVRAPEPLPNHQFICGSLTDQAALCRAFEGAECVIHLAAEPDDVPELDDFGEFPSDGDNFADKLVPSNVIGVYNVLKAAVRTKTRRVILTSSFQVIHGQFAETASKLGAETSYAPRYLYACTKVFSEVIGRVFAKQHGLEVLITRVGWCPRPGQEETIRKSVLPASRYMSRHDAGQFFAAALRSPSWPRTTDPDGTSFTYGIAQVTSLPPIGQEIYDLSEARHLGYEPDPAHDWQAWLRQQEWILSQQTQYGD